MEGAWESEDGIEMPRQNNIYAMNEIFWFVEQIHIHTYAHAYKFI